MPDRMPSTRATASSIVVALAIAALTTAGASAGVATLLTGSPSPSVWLQSYEHAKECQQAGAEKDPNCSAAAAEAMTKLRIAAEIESKAHLASVGKSPATRHVTRPVARPSPAPVFLAAPIQAPPRPPAGEVEGLDG
jgi:hypothetical protein